MNRVSVIIPTYGDNTFPCRAIDSVLNQDYEEVEVVVVDDNGLGTEQQLRNEKVFMKYAGDKRFHYVAHEKNRGGSVARNTGAQASTGAYLCFLDDDDEFADLTKISKQMKDNEVLSSEWAGTYSSLRIFKGETYLRTIYAKNSGFLLEEFIEGDMSIGTAAPIISKKAFESIGGFNESFKRHQDWEFFSRLMDRYKMKAVPEAYYNRHYKLDVARKSATTRLEYMNKYVSYMRDELKSLSPRRLETLMKRKYVSVILAFMKEKNFKKAREICKINKYNFADYMHLNKILMKQAARKLCRKM